MRKFLIVFFFCFASSVEAHETVGPLCESLTHQGAEYTVCKIDPSEHDLRLFLNDSENQPYSHFDEVNAALSAQGERLVFAMNGGMYHKDRRPVGLYIEKGQELKSLSTKGGPGNFHMLPNGVFWQWKEEGLKGAHIASTDVYQKAAHDVVDFATQSGPMLVIDGKLHPRFLKDSDSQKIRNGVGQREDGTLVFVKSETAVTFYDFATFFKDNLDTPNALYLDGTISRLYAKDLSRNDIGLRMGPIIGVVEKIPPKATAHYIANEGILIEQGDTKVLFDPLPLSGFGVYPEPSAQEVEAITAGTGKYAGVDVVFISHAHRDHFSPEATLKLMTTQKDIHLVTPQQGVDYMRDSIDWDEALLSRITALDMAVGDAPKQIEIGAVKASAIRIPHAGWPTRRTDVQNMVYRVQINDDATVIHMGDADSRRQHFTPHEAHWQAQKTDTAFPPYWFLLSQEGRKVLSEDVNAAKAIGLHVPLDVPQDLKASGADYFSKAGETRMIGQGQ